MSLRLCRFSSIMSTAVSMSAAVAHLMELPAKMSYDRDLYVRLHRTLYPNFGRFAGVAEILSVVLTAGLAWKDRQQRSDKLTLTTAAASSLVAAHGAFWTIVHPANTTMANWPLEAIPPDWERWRERWEYAHALRAVLVTGALGALVWSEVQPRSVSAA